MKTTTHALLISVFIAATLVAATVEPLAQEPRDVCGESNKVCSAKPKDRAGSVGAVLSHLGLGEGSVVADIGAGSGQDTWVFAKIVGERGTVFAEEIVESKVKSIEKQAKEKGLSQVRAVLGRDDDPCLPPNSVDFAFLHHVYHHVAKPREMLRGIWRSLRPGGHLVVVDQRRGTLRDWVERSLRGKKHFWIAETTVVREAREEGFAFVECAEECWHASGPFVLVFERPPGLNSPGRDPDTLHPLPVEKTSRFFLPLRRLYQRPVVVALGESRKLTGPILQNASGQGLEIVLEEWATQKDERPPLPPNVSFPSVLTDSGDPHLGPEPVDVVFFLDSYHLLFHGKTLLAKIHEKLSPAGCIYVLDREADKPLSRREASHRRMIEPETVKQEMAEAGFSFWCEGPRPAPDRFLLIFGKTQAEKIPPENDPFVGGPLIPQPPRQWLGENYWRLRGLETSDGMFVPFARQKQKGPVEIVHTASLGKEICRIPDDKLRISFEKKDEAYVVTDCRASEPQE